VQPGCSGAAPQTAPDGRAEIGYKITGICSAVNTLPAPATAALPARAVPPPLAAPQTPRAQLGTSARCQCERGRGATPASPDPAP